MPLMLNLIITRINVSWMMALFLRVKEIRSRLLVPKNTANNSFLLRALSKIPSWNIKRVGSRTLQFHQIYSILEQAIVHWILAKYFNPIAKLQ